MHPSIPIPWLAILVAVVASFAIGGVWYGPLFGATWRAAMGFAPDAPPDGREIARGSALNLLGTFALAFVLAHEVAIWRPSTWGHASPDAHWALHGFFAGAVVWLGYVVPTLLNGPAFERKPWRVFFISAGYQFVSLQAAALILSGWTARG